MAGPVDLRLVPPLVAQEAVLMLVSAFHATGLSRGLLVDATLRDSFR